MDESDELSGLEGIFALTWVSLAVISCIKTVTILSAKTRFYFKVLTLV